MLNRICILSLIILIYSHCPGQTINALDLKNNKHYTEKNKLDKDSFPRLTHEVCYDEPNTIDEEACLVLSIIIYDSTKAKQVKTIDIIKDTAILKCKWQIQSNRNREITQAQISGTITLLAWTSSSISISFDMNINYQDQQGKYKYEGRRTFRKQE